MRRLLLIRHPATRLSGRFCGHSDPDLSARGEAQLSALRQRLEGIPEPYASFTVRIYEDTTQWLSDRSCETLAVVTHRGVLQHLLQTHCALEASAAWQITCRPPTVIFCERREKTPFAVREASSAR